MNIIYLHTHDSGRYWSPYGFAMPTPNIMKFAEGATLFRQAYSAAPTCSPSRSALLTGMNPHESGMQGLAHTGFQLNDYDKHLSFFLKANGYETILSGIQHEAPDCAMLGYDRVLGSQSYSMGDTINSMEDLDYNNTKEACAFIESKSFSKQPFFLSLGLFNTHREFPAVGDDDCSAYLAVPPMLYDCDLNRRDIAGYVESVRVVDNCFGQVLDAIENAGITDDTMIFMTTDHGIAFPHMKCTLYDTGIGVALIIRLPKKFTQVKVTDALVSHLDIFPTICEAAGLTAPQWLEGESLISLMAGKVERVRDEIFAEVTYHAAYEPKRCIRTDRYKLIRRYDYHNGIVPVNIDDCPGKDFLVESGYLNKTTAREYLFDLWLDPMERENLVEDSAYKTVYGDLSSRLEDWMIKTNDPLISHGSRVPKPEGAKIVRLEIVSPRSTEFED